MAKSESPRSTCRLNSDYDIVIDEVRTLLEACGYVYSKSGKTSGSRVKFYLGKKVFAMHKPHQRKELLEYQVKELIKELREEGFYDE